MFFWGAFFIFFFISAFSLIFHANSNTTTATYGRFKLSCYIRCENTYGEGSEYAKINKTTYEWSTNWDCLLCELGIKGGERKNVLAQ